MRKIITHLWFDTQAVEATNFYVSLFENSKIESHNVMKNTPSGDCDFLTFTLAGQTFNAISAGPYFKFNPSISLFVNADAEEEAKKLWDTLIEGGEVMMPYDTYPWAKKYGWLKDKYGLTWQISYSDTKAEQKITPSLMFTKDKAGKAKEAIEFYTSIFPNSKIDTIVPYEKEDGDVEGYTKFSMFTLGDQKFIAMDSSGPHEFVFNEAISFLVECDDQKEIDYWGLELW